MPIVIVKAGESQNSHSPIKSPRNGAGSKGGYIPRPPNKPKAYYGQIDEDDLNSENGIDQIAMKRKLDIAKANHIKRNMTKSHYVTNIPEVLDSLDFKVGSP